MPGPYDVPAIDLTRQIDERLRETRLERALAVHGRELHWVRLNRRK